MQVYTSTISLQFPLTGGLAEGAALVFQGGLMGALREIQLVGCPSPKVRDFVTLRPRIFRPREYFSCSIRPRIVSSKVSMIPEISDNNLFIKSSKDIFLCFFSVIQLYTILQVSQRNQPSPLSYVPLLPSEVYLSLVICALIAF